MPDLFDGNDFDNEADEVYGSRWLLNPATCRRHRLLRSLLHDHGGVPSSIDVLVQALENKGIVTNANQITNDLQLFSRQAKEEAADAEAARGFQREPPVRR